MMRDRAQVSATSAAVLSVLCDRLCPYGLKKNNRRVRGERTETAEKNAILVLTPHPVEMSRLTGLPTAAIQRDRINVARSFAKEHGVILVLKGDRTIVADPSGEAWVNPTGNPGMATGGTGDILTGIVAGMIAQNPARVFQAVLSAVYLHGLAGDIALESVGEHSLVASDLVRSLPEAFQRVRVEAAQEDLRVDGRSPGILS